MIVGAVLVDGVPVASKDAHVSVSDSAVQRGYGCFETIRSYRGTPFRLERHLDRLGRSAAMLEIPIPGGASLAAWVREAAASGGDCAVRVIVTGGGSGGRPGAGGASIVIAEELVPPPEPFRVLPVAAPWHPDGADWALAGAKTLSYAPNLAATMTARRAGFDDALLVGRSGAVLEGPTFSVGWVAGDRIVFPPLALGVLASVTREVVVELADALGIECTEAVVAVERIGDVDELFAMSTNKEVLAIDAVGDVKIGAGPIVGALDVAFTELVGVS